MDNNTQSTPPALTVTEILKGSDYSLTIFTDQEVKALKLFDRGGKPYLTCAASDKPRPAKPEEIVRQLYLRKLMSIYGYPKDRIAIEKPVYFGSSVHEKAADIVVWEKDFTNARSATPCLDRQIPLPPRKAIDVELRSWQLSLTLRLLRP